MFSANGAFSFQLAAARLSAKNHSRALKARLKADGSRRISCWRDQRMIRAFSAKVGIARKPGALPQAANDAAPLALKTCQGCAHGAAAISLGEVWLGRFLPPRFSVARSALAAVLALFCLAADWKTARPGWQYQFPRDHHAHPDFKTEWWYFTGNVFDAESHRFGYELTFFRQGITPPAERDPNASRFIVDDLKFAHFAMTDVSKQRFRFEQKTSRGAFGEAGFDDGKRLAWIDNWSLAFNGDDAFDLMATNQGRRDPSSFARGPSARRAWRKWR